MHLLAFPEEEFLQIDYSLIPHDGVEKITPKMRTKFMLENHTVLLKSPNFLIDLRAVSSHFLAKAVTGNSTLFVCNYWRRNIAKEPGGLFEGGAGFLSGSNFLLYCAEIWWRRHSIQMSRHA